MVRPVSAHDCLNGQQFFHGTFHDFQPGEHVKPWSGRAEEIAQMDEDDRPDNSVPSFNNTYFTASKQAAARYGARVYKVQPEGEYHADPDSTSRDQAYESSSPLRILEKI